MTSNFNYNQFQNSDILETNQNNLNKKATLNLNDFSGFNLINNNSKQGKQTINPIQFSNPFLSQDIKAIENTVKKSCCGGCNGGKGCDGGEDGKGCDSKSSCGSKEKSNSTFSQNNKKIDEKDLINKLSSSLFSDIFINPQNLVSDKVKFQKFDDYNFIQIGEIKNIENVNDLNQHTYSELKILKNDKFSYIPIVSSLQKDGSVITRLKSDNKELLYIRYIKNEDQTWNMDTGLKNAKINLPSNTPMDLFNIIGFSTLVSLNLVSSKREKNSIVSNDSNSVEDGKKKTNKSSSSDEETNCDEECGVRNGVSSTSHGLDCSLPGFFKQVTGGDKFKLWAPCSGTMTFDVSGCCKQHDIDLWCSEYRSYKDVDTDVKYDDWLIDIAKLIITTATGGVVGAITGAVVGGASPGIVDAAIIGLLGGAGNEKVKKSAQYADLKVISCVFGKVASTFLNHIPWYCYAMLGLGAALDTIFIVAELTVGLIAALSAGMFFNDGHQTCLLGLNGRNKDSCLCGGPNPTVCCDSVFRSTNFRTQTSKNCCETDENGNPIYINLDNLPGLEEFERIPVELRSPGININGVTFGCRLRVLCGGENKRTCVNSCIFSSGNIKLDSDPNPDPLRLNRPCSNPDDCDEASSCVQCEEVCEYDSSTDGRFLYKRLIGGNRAEGNKRDTKGKLVYEKQSNVSQYSCCANTPVNKKCPEKSPTWHDFPCSNCWKGNLTNEQKRLCEINCNMPNSEKKDDIRKFSSNPFYAIP